MPWRTIEGDDARAGRRCRSSRCCSRASSRSAASSTCSATSSSSRTRRRASSPRRSPGYHQFHAVNVAVEETLRATGALRAMATGPRRIRASRRPARRRRLAHAGVGQEPDDGLLRRAGHRSSPAMENPTIVVLTDRNDLDDQLFGTFARCHELLRQEPGPGRGPRGPAREAARSARAASSSRRSRSSSPRRRATGTRSSRDRRNIVVIADEAHRSQYDFIDGFARHMRDALPNASFIGFTGTPIELTDANTRAVFGDYISVYDIQRAVEDGATVPIYYESRLAKLELDERGAAARSTPTSRRSPRARRSSARRS